MSRRPFFVLFIPQWCESHRRHKFDVFSCVLIAAGIKRLFMGTIFICIETACNTKSVARRRSQLNIFIRWNRKDVVDRLPELEAVGVWLITCCLFKQKNSKARTKWITLLIRSKHSIDRFCLQSAFGASRGMSDETDASKSISQTPNAVFFFVRFAFHNMYFYISHIRHELKWSCFIFHGVFRF